MGNVTREGNRHLGGLPELLVYAWLLHRVRHGLGDGLQIFGGGLGGDAVRAAERIAGWIVAPSVHPSFGRWLPEFTWRSS